ncbi:hypothetical protein E2605_14810 [Dysgonomonas capnocytophagoides]|uniref:XRE family transcriptional regulator n=1 Tax=Dysgonomonas capnocytophagoides TaxID=45254 RepID=A0A4Y8KWZ9_9BACT|nr:hypothetical protein [Dysgonomonas capnocytophagoides]TFD94641.1 hypothetical protein E2605_14810 [Dysgonomonas capnocytophagoides]
MKERLKKAFNHLKVLGLISNQQDLADKMKYARASVSKALNGHDGYLTDNFITEFCNKFPQIFNPNWLLTGEGEMLKDSQPAKPEEGEPSNYNILVQHLLSQLEKLEQANKELSETNKNLIEENKKLIADNGYYKGLLEQNGIKQTGTDN